MRFWLCNKLDDTHSMNFTVVLISVNGDINVHNDVKINARRNDYIDRNVNGYVI